MSNKKEDVFGQPIATDKEIVAALTKLNGEPLYTNSFGAPVYNVNHASIKKVQNGHTLYELQLNGHYFQISEDVLETLESITRMPDDVGVSIG